MGKLPILLLAWTISTGAAAFEELDIKAAPYGTRKMNRVKEDQPIVGATPGPEEKVQPEAPRRAPSRPRYRMTRRSALPDLFEYDPQFNGRAGIVLSSGGFDGRLGAFFTFTDFTALGGGIGFRNQRFQNDWDESRFTSEMNLRLFIPNTFLFSPYVQGATGYESWRVTRLDENQDRNGAFFIAGAVGLEAAMTKRFGLVVQRTVTRFDKDTPYFIDGEKGRQRRKDRVEVLFQYVI